MTYVRSPQPKRALVAGLFMLALCSHPGDVVHAQSPEFRRAVEQGHRDRLRQVLPNSTSLELFLAEPDPEVSGSRVVIPRGEDPERVWRLEAQYALAQGDGHAVIRSTSDYLESLASGAASNDVQLLLAQGELMSGLNQEAAQRADWLSRHASEPWKGWGLFVQAQAALASGDTTEAIRLFKLSARLKGHEAAAPSHLELGRIYEAQSQAESALRYLTLYRESYPRGLIPVFESTSGASARADRAAGLEYSVQVGVFGDRTNAQRLLERFKAAGFAAELKVKTIEGQKYTAVWVGRYRTQHDAQEARRELETRFDETYRVVARE